MNGGQTGAAQDGETRTAVLASEMAGWRLDRALAAAVPTLSRERLKALVSSGEVTVDGRQERDPARKVKGGEAVSVIIPPASPSEAISQDIPLDIRFEDDHLLVWKNPPAWLSIPRPATLTARW
jgi:23S rRNA pseudouridine1911/1915/1917 synthase